MIKRFDNFILEKSDIFIDLNDIFIDLSDMDIPFRTFYSGSRDFRIFIGFDTKRVFLFDNDVYSNIMRSIDYLDTQNYNFRMIRASSPSLPYNHYEITIKDLKEFKGVNINNITIDFKTF
jgi:hypothetical protein